VSAHCEKLNVRDGSAPFDQPSPAFSAIQLFLIFISLDFPYHYGFRSVNFFDSATLSLIDAALFTFILWITTRIDLARVTIIFLAIPYLLFIPGWLNTPTTIIVSIIFLYCIANTLRATTSTTSSSVTTHDILAFVLIIIWVNLSGAGGYGHQTPDYGIHNARLKDLIDYTWPVHYDKNKNFVYYTGYFLPSAIIGKLSNADIALRSIYPWTILGVTLVLRWLSLLSGWRFSALLVLTFILFGPLDILNLLLLDQHAAISIHDTFTEILTNTDYLDFRSKYDLGFFIGNYPSNTFQLFWSPHQVIAGWLCISLLTYSFLKKQTMQIIFIYALLCLWSPLIMIALFPFVIVVTLTQLWNKKWRDIITIENTLGAGTLSLLFLIFYLGGGLDAIPSPLIIKNFDWANKGWILALFFICAWCAYALTQMSFVVQQETPERIWFFGLIGVLFLLPLKQLGAYSDLLCRGSAPLMFLLLVFILQSIKYYWQQQKQAFLIVLLGLLILGSGSALLQLRTAINQYGVKPSAGNIVNYKYANENLGPDNTFFNFYFRKNLPEKTAVK